MNPNPFKLAYTCPVDWNSMSGDEAKRYCAQCKLHVVNVSDMERCEAEKLIRDQADERLCINYVVDENQQPLFRSDLRRIAVAATLAGSLALSSVAAESAPVKPDAAAVSPAPHPVPDLELMRSGGIVCVDRDIPPQYAVQKGDTLFAIAKREKTTVEVLKALNHLKSDELKPGQVLQLSGQGQDKARERLELEKELKLKEEELQRGKREGGKPVR